VTVVPAHYILIAPNILQTKAAGFALLQGGRVWSCGNRKECSPYVRPQYILCVVN
jgi:hypothetical protein